MIDILVGLFGAFVKQQNIDPLPAPEGWYHCIVCKGKGYLLAYEQDNMNGMPLKYPCGACHDGFVRE